jgi:hypothetical protein
VSHIVEIQTECRDPAAVAAACQRLGLSEPVEGTATLFSAQASGLLVTLPGWLYPAVVNLASGQVAYDNYEGRWGNPAELGRFLQAYAIAKATREAQRRGHQVVERPLADGSIQLTIQVGGRS